MPGIKDAIAGIFKGGITGVGESVKGIIQQVAENKLNVSEAALEVQKEINRANETIISQANDLEKAYLADVKDARDANVKIQESDKASWLAKNIAYLLDIWMGLIWGLFTMYVLSLWAKISNSANVDFTGILSLYTTVTAVFMITVNFHRGTSKGSHDKQKLIDRLQRH